MYVWHLLFESRLERVHFVTSGLNETAMCNIKRKKVNYMIRRVGITVIYNNNIEECLTLI